MAGNSLNIILASLERYFRCFSLFKHRGAYGLMNTRATRVRCDAAASAILRAKVAKVLTDPWGLSSLFLWTAW